MKGIWTLFLGNGKMINIYSREEYNQTFVLERLSREICGGLEWLETKIRETIEKKKGRKERKGKIGVR